MEQERGEAREWWSKRGEEKERGGERKGRRKKGEEKEKGGARERGRKAVMVCDSLALLYTCTFQ